MLLAGIRRLLLWGALLAATLVVVASCAVRDGRFGLAPPDLVAPPDRLTRARLGALADDPALCGERLAAARVRFRSIGDLNAGGACPVAQPFALDDPRLRPAGPAMTCTMAASLQIWLAEVDRVAVATFGERIATVAHYGTYACRRVYGRPEGDWSEHARANAIDVAAFRLRSGRTIRVASGWDGAAEEAAFLREVRDRACLVFGTVLSPDYNAAHADHFHLDQAERGMGWGLCR
jgi:hypothetical protein